MSPNATFKERLAIGGIAEKQIARWLIERCRYSIMPVYEKEINSGKGPQIFASDCELVAPDMLAMRGNDTKWIEAKQKTVFTWHRKTKKWVTGIDLRHYNEYCDVLVRFRWPVWLLFLHKQSQPDKRDVEHGCPPLCPTGLFGGDLHDLTQQENHRHDNWGRSGMVYWAHETLKCIATLADIEAAIKTTKGIDSPP